MTLCAALLVFATALCYVSLAIADCDNDLIDGSAYRLSDQQFSASNSNASEPPHSARKSSGTSWCTEDLVVTDSPWLDVSFGVNVEIRALSTGGWPSITGLFDDYVRSYQVQYAGEGDQHLRYVTEQDNTIPKVFGRAANPNLQRVQLPTPIIAERLRIIVVPGSWARMRACMRVEAHGCLVPNTCPNGFQALSNDRTLLPLASINASSEEDDDPARDLVHTGDEEWCSDQSIESDPHILLDFTQPIVLTHMRSRGGGLGFSYVTEFSVQSHNGSSLEQYQQPNGATTFSVPDHRPKLFTFWRPLTVNTTLRFNILGAVYNNPPFSDKEFCFNVELFGCLLTQANLTTHSILSTATSTSPSIYKPTSTLLQQPHVMTSSSLGSQQRSSLDTTSIGQIASASLVTSPTPVSTRTGASTLATVSVTVDTTTVSVSVVVPLVAAGLLIAGIIAVIVFWRLRQRKQKKTGTSHVYFTVENQTLHGHDDECTTSNPDSEKLNLSCEDYLVPVSVSRVRVGVYEMVSEDIYETVDEEETSKVEMKNNQEMCEKETEKDEENQEDTNNPRHTVIAQDDNDEVMRGGRCTTMEDRPEEHLQERETSTNIEDEEFQMNGRITEQRSNTEQQDHIYY